jgi:ATP phosphoribosyltransferase
MKQQVLKIAIQKSGRLTDKSLQLLRNCGIDIPAESRKLKAAASNFPMELYFLRDDDIPQYVQDGIADIGILGENVLLEKKAAVETVLALGFAKCKLSLAVPRNEQYEGLRYWEGKKNSDNLHQYSI